MRFKFLLFLFVFSLVVAGRSMAQQADPAGFIDPTKQQKVEKKKKAKKPRKKIHWFWKKRTTDELGQRQVEQTFRKSKRAIREENKTYRAHYKSTRRRQLAYIRHQRKAHHAEKKNGGHTKKKLKWG